MARPTKYTPARATKIIEGLKAGMTRTAAAGLVDIDVRSVENWCKRYSSFFAQVVIAEQEAEARYVGVIAKAAFGHEVVKTITTQKVIDGKSVTETKTETYQEYDWQAAKYWLSRRRRKDWGDNLHVELDDEIRQLLAALAGQYADPAPSADS